MDSGYFLFSLDTELAWGHYDYDDLRAKLFSPDGSRERRKIERILAIFNEFEIVGTWAIVGHLWYERCVECEVCPVLEWRGRYASADQIIGTATPCGMGRTSSSASLPRRRRRKLPSTATPTRPSARRR